MENEIVKETTDILKRLSPKNQAYLMTLARVADVAECGVRNRIEAGRKDIKEEK